MNKAAVELANKAVPLATTPAERKAWMDAYIEAGGTYKTLGIKPVSIDPYQQAKKLSQKNQIASNPQAVPGIQKPYVT